MVSEQYDSMDRELQFSYSVFDVRENDMTPQKDESTKKKVTPLKSFVSEFQQQFQNQMAIFNQKLNEMVIEAAKTRSIILDEIQAIRSETILHTEHPPLVIASGGVITTEEAVQEIRANLTLDGPVKTEIINGEVEKKKRENGEKNLPIEGKEERSIEEGSPDSMIDNGDSNTTEKFVAGIPETMSPESGELRSRSGLDPEPKPPDTDPPLFLGDFFTIPSPTEGGAAIRMDSSISSVSNIESAQIHVDKVMFGPQMAQEKAQSNLYTVVYKHRPFLGPKTHQDPSSQPFDHHGSDLGGNCNANDSDSRSSNASKMRNLHGYFCCFLYLHISEL